MHTQVWDRDVNAAKNMFTLLQCMISGQDRPAALRRRQNGAAVAAAQDEDEVLGLLVADAEQLEQAADEDEL